MALVKAMSNHDVDTVLVTFGSSAREWPVEKRVAVETAGMILGMIGLGKTFGDLPEIKGFGPGPYIAIILSALSIVLGLVAIGMGATSLAAIVAGLC